MSININFNRRVHANNTKSPNDFWGVGNLLWPKEEPVEVLLPVVIEMFKAFRRKANRSSSGKIKTSRVEKIEECILQDFGPYFEVAEIRICKTTYDAVLLLLDNRITSESERDTNGYGPYSCLHW